MFEIGKKYKIEYEKELFDGNVQIITYTGEIISLTDSHVEIKTIRNENLALRIRNIARRTELKEESQWDN